MQAAQSTGYERNHLAQSLRSGRSGMLGLVIPDIANPFWAEVARGAQDKAAQQNMSLLVFNSDWGPVREANHLRALRQARVDGAIVNPVEDSIDELGRFGMPVVLIGSSAERFPELPSVGSDIAQGVRMGLEHPETLGHHQPAILAAPVGRLARARFMRVVHDYMVERGRDPGSMLVEDGEHTVDSGKSAMRRILKKPDFGQIGVFAVNDLRGVVGPDPFAFITDAGSIRWALVFSEIWRSAGWGTLLYFAAIVKVDPQLYDAAGMDGANRWKKIIYVTIPGIVPTIATLFILNVGLFLNAGFDQVLNLANDAIRDRIDIIDTYVYRIGLQSGQFALATAAGLFKGVVGMLMIVGAHTLSKKLTGKGVW